MILPSTTSIVGGLHRHLLLKGTTPLSISNMTDKTVANRKRGLPPPIHTEKPSAPKARRTNAASFRLQRTIDEKHREMVVRFQHQDEIEIPKIEAEIERALRAHRALRPSQASMKRELELKETVARLRSEIVKMKEDRKKYYARNATHLFQYFEEKKNSASASSAPATTPAGQTNALILAELFGVQSTTPPETKEAASSSAPPPMSNSTSAARYWYNVEGGFPNLDEFVVPASLCTACGSGQLVNVEEDGVMICENPECGAVGQGILDGSKNVSGESSNETSSVQYERLSHFKEILSQFQAKITTTISPEIMAAIRARIKKERITSINQIDYDKMREMLTILKFNKLFGHIPFINSILGIKPPFMDDMLHNTLCKLFVDIQQPWSYHCPPDRVKFFSYTYVLHQLCVLLGQNQYLPFIPAMKDVAKQHSMNLIWQKVCDHLDWEYTPM